MEITPLIAPVSAELLAHNALIAQQLKVLNAADPKVFRREAEEIYARYVESGQINQNGRYVETSKYIDNCPIDIEVVNGQVVVGYFNHQACISYWPGSDAQAVARAQDNKMTNTIPLFSMIKYSANMVTADTSINARTI